MLENKLVWMDPLDPENLQTSRTCMTVNCTMGDIDDWNSIPVLHIFLHTKRRPVRICPPWRWHCRREVSKIPSTLSAFSMWGCWILSLPNIMSSLNLWACTVILQALILGHMNRSTKRKVLREVIFRKGLLLCVYSQWRPSRCHFRKWA